MAKFRVIGAVEPESPNQDMWDAVARYRMRGRTRVISRSWNGRSLGEGVEYINEQPDDLDRIIRRAWGISDLRARNGFSEPVNRFAWRFVLRHPIAAWRLWRAIGRAAR